MLPFADITIAGNLGRDPETKYTPNGSMTVEFSVAVSRKSRDTESTNWYRVTCWGKLAETMDNLANQGSLLKGSQVLVQGELTVREFTKRDGDAGYSLDINARRVNLAGGRPNGDGGRGYDDDGHNY